MFFYIIESASYDTKTLREDRTAADRKMSLDATRRRRRISQARFFFMPENVCKKKQIKTRCFIV